MAGIRIAAVMAVHNRKALTLACLDSLRAQQVAEGTLDVFVLDDASTDGTAEAVRHRHPDVGLLDGDGHQYWNGGMRRALGAAMAGDYDYYLWMNDDTTLVDDGALELLLRTEQRLRQGGRGPVIVVGSTQHPETGELTYGGQTRPSRRRRLSWALVPPGDEPRQSETMNGNIVLVPRAVVRRIGNIDPAYIQQLGDLDYGLRARAAGCEVWLAPGTAGLCASHPSRRTDRQPLQRELARLWSVKELAPRPWFVFAQRWAGPLWFCYWLSPYMRRGLGLVLQRTGVLSTVSGVR
ncbi:acetylglucosaminyltransferase [Actinomycetospora sp. NBRC 106375]|uniref:glycosyltransferase family 2 protein n=1 Tax=Actinomycetospora sp. NBRC 106375 TaxID=3032207 RepID=UPI0024A5215A|nr:glycosyltransferase family 2 protein [Actinomycetospora sp. NBRC 106375]GLZ46963.1 acetylglucosaminyltransferase [Actinomycetospora sp. NBRC 106375]